MPLIQVHRTDGSLIAEREADSLRVLLEQLVNEGISLNYAQLNNANLNDAKLNGAKLNDAQLNGAQLNGAQLNYAQLNDAKLNGAKLNYAQLNYAQGDILQMNGGKHSLIAVPDGRIFIGCQTGTYEWWMQQQDLAECEGYGESLVEEYKLRLEFAQAWIQRTAARLAAKEVA